MIFFLFVTGNIIIKDSQDQSILQKKILFSAITHYVLIIVITFFYLISNRQQFHILILQKMFNIYLLKHVKYLIEVELLRTILDNV